MRLLVVTSPALRVELQAQPFGATLSVEWLEEFSSPSEDVQYEACLDLLFKNTSERINWLKGLNTSLIIVSSMIDTIEEIGENFIRVCSWKTLLARKIVEASYRDEMLKEKATDVFAQLGRSTEWIPDIPGFVSPRIISLIINEAFLAMEEKVSVESEIDIAMKLGTNYPYGPFEWGRKIGFEEVYLLLLALSRTEKRYYPCGLLKDRILV
jgi:3-hydroxybutyryl-CoA dehydrogenase